ncbi:MAG: PKD-like domain-containing protein, partial [Lewinella sp.]
MKNFTPVWRSLYLATLLLLSYGLSAQDCVADPANIIISVENTCADGFNTQAPYVTVDFGPGSGNINGDITLQLGVSYEQPGQPPIIYSTPTVNAVAAFGFVSFRLPGFVIASDNQQIQITNVIVPGFCNQNLFGENVVSDPFSLANQSLISVSNSASRTIIPPCAGVSNGRISLEVTPSDNDFSNGRLIPRLYPETVSTFISVIPPGSFPNTAGSGFFIVETSQNIPAGDYAIVIYDTNADCEVVHELTLGSSTSQVTPALSASPVTCFGDTDGSITISANPGNSGTNGPVTYILLDDNDAFVRSGTLNATSSTAYSTEIEANLPAGDYTVNITTVNGGCMSSDMITIGGPDEIVVTGIVAPTICADAATFDLEIASIMGAGTTGRYRLIDGSIFDNNVANSSCWTIPMTGRDPLSSGDNLDGTYTFTLGTADVGVCRDIDQDTTIAIVLEILNTATGCTNQFPFTLQIDAQPDTPEVSHSAMAGGGEITGGFYCSGQDITIEIADYDPAFTYDVAYTEDMDVSGNGAFAATMFTYTGTGSVVGSFDNPTNGARTIDFTVTKENNATGCVSEVEDFSLSIRPLPVVDPILNDEVIVCSNEEFESDEITLNDDGGNGNVRFDYVWSFDPALLSISGAISDTDLESADQVFATFTNTSGVAQVATLTITPTFPQNSPAIGGGQLDNACEGESSTITVTVSPRPTLSYDLNIGGLSETLTGGDVEAYEICNGDDFQLDNLMIPEDHAGNKAKYVRYRVLGDARFLQINTGGSNFDLDDVQTTQFLPIANFAIGQPNIQNNHPDNNAQVAQIILVPYFEDEVGGPDFPLCRGEAIRIFLTLNPTAPALMSPQTEIVCSDERIEYTIDGASGSGGNLETRITETNVFSGVTDDFYVVPEGADRIENFSFTISGANGGGTIPTAAAAGAGGFGASVSGELDENELVPGDTIRIRKGLAGTANTSNGNGGDATLLTVTRPGAGLVYTFVAAGGGGAGNGEDGRNARTFTMDPAGDGAQGQGPGGFGGTGNPDARGGDGNVNGGGGGGGYVGGNGGDSQSGESGQGGASFRSPSNELATFSVKASDEPADGEASIFYTVVYDDIRFSLAQPVDVPTGLTPVGETIVDGEVDTILFGQQFVNMTNEAIDVTYLFNTTTEANCNDGGQVEVIITVEPEPTASIVSGGTTVTGDAINGFEATVCSGDPLDAVLQSMTIPSQGVGDLRFMVDATFSGAGVFGNNSGRASSGNFDGFYSGSDLDIPFFETGVFNNNGVDGTITYNITPVLADNGSNFPGSSHNNPLRSINYCEGQTFTFTVTVEPGFTADLNPGQFDVCSRGTLGSAPFDLEADQADDVNVAFSSIRLVGYRVSTMDPNFTAVSIVDTTGLSSGGVILTQAGNYFENDTYRNLTGDDVTVEYDIILISEAGCESQVITYEFLIRAEPVISTMGTEVTVCEGEATGLRTFPATNSAFEASWTNTGNVTFTYDLDPGNLIYLGNINYPVGGAGVGAFRFQNDAFENPTSVPQTATYTVFATTSFGCVGDPVTYTVTVLPDPELTADIEAGGVSETLVPQDDFYIYELCSGDDFSLGNLNFTSVGAPNLSEYVEFSISGGEEEEFLNIDDIQGLLLDANGFLIGSEGVQNTSTTPYIAFITLTPYLESDVNNPDINDECVGESIQIIVILNPEVTGIPTPQSLTVCSEEPIDFSIDTGVDPLFSLVRGSHDFANGTDFVFPDNAAFIPFLLFEASSADGGDALNNENAGASGLEAEGAFNILGGSVIPGDTLRAILGQPGADGVMAGAGGGATSIAVIGGPNRGGNEGSIIEQVVIGGGGGAGALENAENNFPFTFNAPSGDGANGAGPGGNGGSGAPTFAGGTGVNNGGGGGGGWVGGEGGNSLSGSAGQSGTSFDSDGFLFGLDNKDGMAGAGGAASITYAIAFDDVIFTVTGKDVPAPLDASGAQLGVGDAGLDTLLNGETFVNNTDEAIVVTYTLSTGTEANCPGGVVEINVTVEPNPTLSMASDATMILEDGEGNYSAEICSGDSLSAILSSMTIPSTGVSNLIAEVVDVETGPDISFNTSNGSRASGPNGNFGGNNFPAQADVSFFEDEIINVGTSAQQVVYTVVPSISRVGEPSCFGDTIRLTVTVYPEFVGVNVTPPQVNLCSNVSLDDSGFDFDATQTITNMIAFDSIIIDTVYNNVSLANAANFETISSVYSGSPLTLRRSEGFFGTDTYRNRTGAPAIVTYEVRLVSGPGCTSETITYNFRYTAEPVILTVESVTNQIDTTICNTDATGLTVNPAANSAWSDPADFQNNVVLEYEAVVPMGVILTNGTYPATGDRFLMVDDELENTTDAPLDVVYTVSPFNNGCAGDPVTYTVTVNPNPDATVELTSLDSTATFSLENSRAFLNPNPVFGMCSGQALTTTVPAAAT